MSTLVLILRKIVSFVRLLCMPFKWLFDTVFKTRSSNIGELPFQVVSQHPASDPTYAPNATGGTWNSWNENSFNFESKIEEYRRKRAELLQQQQQLANTKNHSTMQPNITNTLSTTSNAEQVDYFNEMQPKFKPPKKLHLQNVEATGSGSKQQRNMFEMREGEVFVPETAGGELGDLDLDPIEWSATGRLSADRTTSWSEDVDDNELAIDELAREQKRREREEKHKQRLQDHERRMSQKRGGGASQQIGRLK